MKKNGFTLIEMIAVVTILAVILLVTLPSLTGTLKKANEKAYTNFLDDLYMAAENYVVISSDLFPQLSEINGAAFIKVSELINAGYIKDDFEDPKIEAPVNPNATIRVRRNNDLTYDYKYSNFDSTTNAYNRSDMMLYLDGYNYANGWSDLSGKNVETVLNNFDDTSGWQGDKVLFDGINDYAVINNLEYNSSTGFTLEFVGKIDDDDASILFESSVNSNSNEGSYYIDTNEFGSQEITLAMKFNTSGVINHQMVNNVLEHNGVKHYALVFDSTAGYNNFISIYINGVKQETVASDSNCVGDVSNKVMNDYPLYVASRAGSSLFTQMTLSSLRLYNKALTQNEISDNFKIDEARFDIEY